MTPASPTTCATVRKSVGLEVGMNMDMICANYVRNGEEQCGLVGTEIGRYDLYVTNYVRNGEECCGLVGREIGRYESYINGLCKGETCRYDSYVVTDLRMQP